MPLDIYYLEREHSLLEGTQVLGEYNDKQVWISKHEPGKKNGSKSA